MPAQYLPIAWFKDLNKDDIPIAGGKGANLGEMYQLGIPVPNGFVVTSAAYFKFIADNHLDEQIKHIISACNVNDSHQLAQTATKIQSLIRKCTIGPETSIPIMKAYRQLGGWAGLRQLPVAVRSSATAEDLPDASFAGQQETYLNVIGESNLLKRVQDCWASLFTPRAIFYREKQHYSHLKIGIAVPVQVLVDSKISGIMFSVNPVNRNKDQIVIETIWGLGEYIVQGKITPDSDIVDKSSWQIIHHHTTAQTRQLKRSTRETSEVDVPKSLQQQAKLTPKEVLSLAKIAQKLHNHYAKPQDMEFALDSSRKIYIVQSRPITTLHNLQTKDSTTTTNLTPILSGQSASPGQAQGKVVILKSPKEINLAKKGDVLVTYMTSPDFVPAMRRVSAIITDAGGQTSHAAIVSRELGVPCIVGTKTATKTLKAGQIVFVDATSGNIYPAQENINASLSHPERPQGVEGPELSTKPQKTATKLYVNLGEPELAKKIAQLPVDGVGLLRAEFIMATIGVHPKHMIKTGEQEKYVKMLTNGLLKFARAFNPRPIIYRASDFKTNEYKHLKYGHLYEPEEPNPMLGFRGATRYIHNPEVFQLELEAIKRVRNKWGYRNLQLMIPFTRTPQELMQVKKIITDAGLIRSPSFKLYLMVEIPSNVILLDQFIDTGIDGISIGSNDLTMLTLGLDRDNESVAPSFNEMDPAVLWMLEKAVTTATKRGITSSICGQAPSNHPDLVEKLVKWGITGISVSPDAVGHTRQTIAWAEKQRILKK